jgi:hypothetical protein
VSVQGRQAGQAAVDPNELRGEWQRAAAANKGVRAEDVGGFTQQFVSRTGELGIARAWQNEIATVISATDATGAELGDTMATLFQKFDIKSVEEMKDAMATLVSQGKKGAFELSDAAAYLPAVGAAAARFGGSMKGAGGMKVLGGMMQIARGSAGRGAPAATAVEAMFRQIVAESANIKKSTGVSVFKSGKGIAKNTVTNDFMTLLPAIIGGAKGDLAKLQDIFKDEGMKAVSPLITEFSKVTAAGGSVKDGMAAVSKMMTDATEAGGTWAEVQQDAAIRQTDSANQMTGSWETVKGALDGLTPVAMKLADQFAGWISQPGFADGIQVAVD